MICGPSRAQHRPLQSKHALVLLLQWPVCVRVANMHTPGVHLVGGLWLVVGGWWLVVGGRLACPGQTYSGLAKPDKAQLGRTRPSADLGLARPGEAQLTLLA